MHAPLQQASERLFQALQKYDQRVVFAESCTGGLVSATLARTPGISGYLCGSAVVYQEETKVSWLKIDVEVIDRAGVVSSIVAEEMAFKVLTETPHATVSASITGHLGPEAPPELDGVVHIGIARELEELGEFSVISQRFELDVNQQDDLRVARQRRAATLVMKFLYDYLHREFQ